MKQFNLLLFIFLLIFFASCQKKYKQIAPSVFSEAEYSELKPDVKIAFLDSLVECCIPTHNDSISRKYLFDLSSEYFFLNAQEKSRKINKYILQVSAKAADTASMARANYYIADNFEPYKKDSAYHYYLQAEKLYRAIDHKEQTARMKFNKAVLLFYEGNYVESEIELSAALQLLVDSEDRKLLFACYNLMGSNFEKLDDYDNAMKYYLLSKKVLEEMAKEGQVIDRQNNYPVTSSVNIANIYEKTGRHKEAIAELESIIDEELERQWPAVYAVAVGNLGYSKMKKGDLKEAEPLLVKSLQVSQKYDREAEVLYKLNNLGEYYALTGDTAKSVRYLRKSLEISERTRAGEEIKSTLKLLSRMDPERDANYKEKYIRYTDSLYKTQRENRNKYARIEYETARVEDQNRILTTKNVKIVLVSILVIFLLVLLLIYRYVSSQKRELEFKKQQQMADEELFILLKEHQLQVALARQHEQNRISKELHDGIMNRIYAVRLHLDMLNHLDDKESKAKRLKFVDMLQEIEKEVRLISHDLHIDHFQHDSDYILLLTDFITQQNGISKTNFVFDHDPAIPWDDISGLIKITIQRTLQETILNVNKYAEARNCQISIRRSKDELIVSVEDDGKGFDVEKQPGGIGIKNLRSRAKSVDGRLVVESQMGQGTKVVLHIPIVN